MAQEAVRQEFRGAPVDEGTIPRVGEVIDHRRFTDIKIYTNDQVTTDTKLGEGHFADVWKGTLTIAPAADSSRISGSTGSRGDSTSALVENTPSKKSKIGSIKFMVAVKELKADPSDATVKMVVDQAHKFGIITEAKRQEILQGVNDLEKKIIRNQHSR